MKRFLLFGIALFNILTCSGADINPDLLLLQNKKNDLERAIAQAKSETKYISPPDSGDTRTGRHNLHVNPDDADIPIDFQDYDKAALTSTTNKHLVESYEQAQRALNAASTTLHGAQQRVLQARHTDAKQRVQQLQSYLVQVNTLRAEAGDTPSEKITQILNAIPSTLKPAENPALNQALQSAQQQHQAARENYMTAYTELRDNILRYSDAARAKEKSRQEMATTIAAAAAKGEARQRMIEEHRTEHEQRQHVQRTYMAKLLMAGIPLAVISTVLGYYLIRHKFQPRPRIIEESDTSIRSFFERLRGIKPPKSNINELVLSPELSKKVLAKFNAISAAIVRKMPLSNLLFYGPAGTGKTMAAQAFARKLHESGAADHVIIRGGAFKRFTSTNEAQKALADTLRWASHSKKPVILIFDEAETMFCDRESKQATELTRDLTVTMLSFFEKAISKKMMFILSTNLPHLLDRALLNRVDPSNRVKFLLPDIESRIKLIDVYLNKHVVQNGIAVPQELRDTYPTLGARMDGLAGRQIESWAVQALYEAVAQQLPSLSKQILNDALHASTEQVTLSAY